MRRGDQGIPDDLFHGTSNSLPGIQASETLYSWCARFHRLSGGSRAQSTSQVLFRHPSVGLRHDFPGHLAHLGSITRGLLGTSEEISLRRTHFGLFAPFLSSLTNPTLLAAMRTGTGASVRKRLGIHRSGLAINPPLKACAQCLEEDRATIPSSWWRMEHQWAPVRVCLRHGEALLAAPEDLYTPFPNDWHLPGDLPQITWRTIGLTNEQRHRLANIALWTEAVTCLEPSRFDPEILRFTYHLQAKARGWVAFDGSLRFQVLRDAFRIAYADVEGLAGMEFLEATAGANGGFLNLLLRDYPGVRHPHKQIYLMAFLFETPAELLAMYDGAKQVIATDGIDGLKKQLTDTRAQLTNMVAIEQRSVNSACRELDVPPALAIRHLKLEGVEYRRRPRVLTPALQERLDALLASGEDRGEIASALGIRKAFIKDYLANRPELRLAWRNAYGTKKRAGYREHFLRILNEHPGVPIKRIRQISGNGFEWLYRNDLDWLRGHLPEIWRRPS